VGLLVVSRSALKLGSITGRRDDVPGLESFLTMLLAACSCYPPTFPFAGSAPDAPPLPVLDGVVETSLQDRAAAWVVRMGSQAHAACFLHLGIVVLVVAVEEISR